MSEIEMLHRSTKGRSFASRNTNPRSISAAFKEGQFSRFFFIFILLVYRPFFRVTAASRFFISVPWVAGKWFLLVAAVLVSTLTCEIRDALDAQPAQGLAAGVGGRGLLFCIPQALYLASNMPV
jgi:hypothetical protein